MVMSLFPVTESIEKNDSVFTLSHSLECGFSIFTSCSISHFQSPIGVYQIRVGNLSLTLHYQYDLLKVTRLRTGLEFQSQKESEWRDCLTCLYFKLEYFDC